MTEDYCWAKTQIDGRSCCGRSGSSVLDFGFQLDSLLFILYVTDHMCIELRLEQDLWEAWECLYP